MRHVFDFLTIYLVTFVIDHEVLKLNLYMSRLDTLWCINKSADFPRIGQFWILTYRSVLDPSDHLIFLELNTLRYNRTNNDNIKNSSMRVLKSYWKLINNAMGRSIRKRGQNSCLLVENLPLISVSFRHSVKPQMIVCIQSQVTWFSWN